MHFKIHGQNGQNNKVERDAPYGYAKDAKRVYYHDKVVKGADPETFTGLDEQRFKDKNHRYRYGRIWTE